MLNGAIKKQIKLMMERAYQNHYQGYKSAIRDLLSGKEGPTSDERLQDELIRCRRIYLDRVSSQIAGVEKGAERVVWARRCLAISSPNLAGLPPVGENYEHSAGVEYCIAYYAFTGERADPKEAIEQNHIFASYVARAIDEIEDELYPKEKSNKRKQENIGGRKGAPYWLVAVLCVLCIGLLASRVMDSMEEDTGKKEDRLVEELDREDGVEEQDTEIEFVYVTENGEKYHQKGCPYLRGDYSYMSLDKAIQRGYEPCSRCW